MNMVFGPRYFLLIPKVCRQGLELRRWASNKPLKMGILFHLKRDHIFQKNRK
jgi:hypothetical protein